MYNYKYLKSICKMDKKEIHNLSEAYLEVYEQSIVDRAKNAVGHQRAGTHGDDDEINQNQGAITKNLKKLRPYGEKGFPSVKKEEVEIYDCILSHLIDEGYAETEKSAEAIVENMSEEWMENVVEEIINELRRSEKEGKGSIQSPLGFRGQNRQRGAEGGRRWESGGEGGSRRERGKKKNEPGSQHQRLNPPEKKGRQLERGTKAATDRAYGYGQGRYQGD